MEPGTILFPTANEKICSPVISRCGTTHTTAMMIHQLVIGRVEKWLFSVIGNLLLPGLAYAIKFAFDAKFLSFVMIPELRWHPV